MKNQLRVSPQHLYYKTQMCTTCDKKAKFSELLLIVYHEPEYRPLSDSASYTKIVPVEL